MSKAEEQVEKSKRKSEAGTSEADASKADASEAGTSEAGTINAKEVERIVAIDNLKKGTI